MKDVWMKSPIAEVKNSAIEFEVNENRKRIGTLYVSKSRIVWNSRNKVNGKGLSWTDFEKMMLQYGQDIKRS